MSTPTQAQVRAARHAGFKNSLLHMPEAKLNKTYTRYEKQDARRERNITGFVQQVRGAK